MLEIFAHYFGKYSVRLWGTVFAISLEATQELANLYCPGQLSVLQLLTLLHWLSEYPTWDRMSQVWKADPKTLRDHINSSLLALYDNLSEIDWERRLEVPTFHRGPFVGVTFLVDVTIVPLPGFSGGSDDPNWKSFYSAKHKLHCWKYTGIISALGGFFVYFSEVGFPGSVHDKNMWDLENLSSALNQGEYGLADKGYEGVDKLLTPWKGKELDDARKSWNFIIENLRAKVENAFSRLKLFKILSTGYRGERGDVHLIANVCVQLVNLNLEYHPLRREKPHEMVKNLQWIQVNSLRDGRDFYRMETDKSSI